MPQVPQLRGMRTLPSAFRAEGRSNPVGARRDVPNSVPLAQELEIKLPTEIIENGTDGPEQIMYSLLLLTHSAWTSRARELPGS